MIETVWVVAPLLKVKLAESNVPVKPPVRARSIREVPVAAKEAPPGTKLPPVVLRSTKGAPTCPAKLSATVLADVVDRWLLLALAICAVPLPLNALWFFWLARTGVVGWMPRPLDMQLYRLAAHALVLFVVLHRRRLSRTGILVTGLGDVSG